MIAMLAKETPRECLGAARDVEQSFSGIVGPTSQD